MNDGSRHTGEANGSMLDRFELGRVGKDLWREFAEYHYRSEMLFFVSDIFAFRYCSGEYAAIVIYSYPHANGAMRNELLGERYRHFQGQLKLSVLNHELRTISRVVVKPQFRGISLGSELIRRTMSLVNVRFVEVNAVMAKVNSCFERAGMRYYPPGVSKEKDSIVASLGLYGIDIRDEYVDIERRFQGLGESEKENVIAQLHVFCCHYNRAIRKRSPERGRLRWYVGMVKFRVNTKPGYYFWDSAGEVGTDEVERGGHGCVGGI